MIMRAFVLIICAAAFTSAEIFLKEAAGSVSCNCNPDEAPRICAADGSDGQLVAHANCNQFFKCDKRLPYVLNCPGSLLYNPYSEQCDWPDKVDCSGRVVPVIENSNENSNENVGDSCNCNPAEAPEICAADGSDGQLVAHVNCNQFFKCDKRLPYVLNCPGSLLYNPYSEQCDWPEKVDCSGRVVPVIENSNENSNENVGDSCNCNPAEAPEICAADGSDGQLVAHANCNQFFKCADRLPYVLNCPGSLLYNPYSEQCDWPEKVDCSGRVVPDSENGDGNGSGGTCNCNPAEAPEICAADRSDSILVAHENCDQYYVCSLGQPVAMKCPGSLLYNPHSEQCDWPEHVNCGDRLAR